MFVWPAAAVLLLRSRRRTESRPLAEGVTTTRLTNYLLHAENAEGYVLIAVYLFIYLYACYSHNSKSIKPNRMKFGGMIGYYPGTI